MPTGYTADLHEGEQSFEDFVLGCARAFGALITLRDTPNAEIPEEFKPDPWHEESLAKAIARSREVEAWSDEEAERAAQGAYELALARHEEAERVREARSARYRAMLANVERWNPPTPDHVNLKEFMREQLRSSLDFDSYESKPPIRQPGPEYKAYQLDRANNDIEYHRTAIAKDRERAKERTEWVRALRESLTKAVPA